MEIPLCDEESSQPSILLVEDNEVNQKVALLMLKRLGHHADVVTNGLEALRALEVQHYDILLMDIHMPKMDGLESTKAIRARWPPAEQPYIIAITAYALLYSVDMCIRAGMDDYLCKPFSMDELRIAIDGYRGHPQNDQEMRI
jgi:CheY-like chemotaxis protein